MNIRKIAKITTEDCVEYLVEKYNDFYERGDPNVSKMWKRRSKKAVGDSIVRIFENTKTHQMYEVIEKNGSIFAANPVSSSPAGSVTAKTKYVCGWATVRNPSSEEEYDGYLVLSSREGFEENGYGDEQIDEDICVALQKYNVTSADETNFEIPRGKKVELQNALVNDPQLRSLVQYSDAFQRSLVRDVSVYEFNYDRPSGASPQGGSPRQAPNQVPSNNQKPIYYVIARGEGFAGSDMTIIIFVTDSDEFNQYTRSSDWTPDGAIEELERLGYSCGEMAEGEIEFNDSNIDVEGLKRKLASSSVFQFSPAYYRFMQAHAGDCEIIPM